MSFCRSVLLARTWLVSALLAATACGSPPHAGTPSEGQNTGGVSVPQAATPSSPGAMAAAIPSTTPALPLSTMPSQSTSALPRQKDAETLLREEVSSWSKVAYKDNGTTRSGIGNAQFVRAVFRGSFDTTIPASYDDLIHSGKLVARDSLDPGDLVFFEGKGFGPFRTHAVGIFLGRGQFAIATKETGVRTAKLSDAKWDDTYKTGRRMSSEKNAEAPTFDATKYGSTEELLSEVAKAWSGTLYKQGGTTFEGIGNDEFIRNIYEAIYDTELDGTPKQWVVMGTGVKRADLKAGDIILYKAVGVGSIVNQRHAGMYIGDGEFVHSVKGSAVTISKLNEERWRKSYVTARRLDPDELTRAAERRAALTRPSTAPPSSAPGGAGTPVPRGDMTSYERQLRDATEPWKGTPYKLGGTSKSGVDCSAFVRSVYQDVYGVELPRTAELQERLGAKVNRKELVAGDLVFFRTQGMGPFFKSRHVGLYLGNGEFAQASGRLGVNVARLDNYYWNKKYEGARRLPKG